MTQIVEVVASEDRDGLLLRLLAKYHASRKNRVLVFVLYKKEVRVLWDARCLVGEASPALPRAETITSTRACSPLPPPIQLTPSPQADRVERFLTGRGWASCCIHGDMSQDARTRAFNSFKDGKVPLLVATDVVS